MVKEPNFELRKICVEFERKLNFFSDHVVISLFIIGFIALLIRLYHFPFGIPITLDGLLYFWYANDISILGHLPSYLVGNDGWPIFLSIFFSIFHFNNFMDYMVLQRVVTVSISVLTIVPVYLLCKRFLDKPHALVGATIFAFEPRIIQNSLLGITDPLYVILVTIALFLFLSTNKKIIYASFSVMALSTLVRTEGFFLFFALSIIFFILYRKEKKIIGKYALAASIFILTLLPMMVTRIDIGGGEPSINKIQSSAIHIIQSSSQDGVGLASYLLTALETSIKFLGWIMIPVFIFFVPIGFLLILKNRNRNSITIITIMVIMFMPAFYAFSTEAFDTRYLFPLYPLFSILSIFAVKFFGGKFTNRNTFLILLMGGILLSSSLFLDFKKMDIEHEKEALSLAYDVVNRTKVINQYYPESKYIEITILNEQKEFPILSSDLKIKPETTLFLEADSLEEYIKLGRERGLTHLVLDGRENSIHRPSFFKDVFYNEEKYPYLKEVFDSWDYGYKYHLKIYKIDYEGFNV